MNSARKLVEKHIADESKAYGESFESGLKLAEENNDWNLLRTIATVHFNGLLTQPPSDKTTELREYCAILVYYLFTTVKVSIQEVTKVMQSAMQAKIALLESDMTTLQESKKSTIHPERSLEDFPKPLFEEDLILFSHGGGLWFLNSFLSGKSLGVGIEVKEEPGQFFHQGIWLSHEELARTYKKAGAAFYARHAIQNLDQPVSISGRILSKYLLQPPNVYELCLPHEYRSQLSGDDITWVYFVYEPLRGLGAVVTNPEDFISKHFLVNPDETDIFQEKITSLGKNVILLKETGEEPIIQSGEKIKKISSKKTLLQLIEELEQKEEALKKEALREKEENESKYSKDPKDPPKMSLSFAKHQALMELIDSLRDMKDAEDPATVIDAWKNKKFSEVCSGWEFSFVIAGKESNSLTCYDIIAKDEDSHRFKLWRPGSVKKLIDEFLVSISSIDEANLTEQTKPSRKTSG